MLRHLVLDEREQPGGGAHGLVDPEQVEVLLVARVVDARDRLLDAVALLGDLGDDEVVLVVAGDGEHEVGRPGDPGALEDGDLRRVAEHRGMAELRLELGEAVAPLLDDRDLALHLDERARDVRADLAAAGDDHVHQPATWGSGTSHARTASVRVAIAVCVGQTVRSPSFA